MDCMHAMRPNSSNSRLGVGAICVLVVGALVPAAANVCHLNIIEWRN